MPRFLSSSGQTFVEKSGISRLPVFLPELKMISKNPHEITGVHFF